MGLGLFVGLVLLGGTTLRARVLPQWCGVLLIVSLPLATGIAIPLGNYGEYLVFGLVWLALGYALWRQRSVAAQQPPPVQPPLVHSPGM